MAATRRRKAAPAEPVEEVEGDAFEELDDLEDDVEEAPAAKPAKRTRRTRTAEPVEEVEETPRRARKAAPAKAAAAATEDTGSSEYNTSWLAEYASEVTGVDMDGRAARMLLRKMANDGDLDRTVGEDRGRYTFPKGANDATVKKFISRVKNGDMTSARREGLEKVTKKKAAAEVDEAPAPRRTRKAPATKAAPAKATPARTRRTRAAAE